jgi:CRISPR/Cas system-associated exonuclease Cas4 (RecB family)
MQLPENFHFTASNLQDYQACERRFELKAIQQRAWPALPSQPVQEQEAHMRNGAMFHQYVHQYLLGVPAELITNLIHEPTMLPWWQNFLDTFPEQEKHEFIAFEHTIAGFLHSFPVLAKVDAIRIQNNRWIVYDWKTGYHQPKTQTMQARIQTHFYMYLLTTNGAALNQGQPVLPEQIQMIYWYPEFPTRQILIPYSKTQHEENEHSLTTMMQEISAKEAGEFALTKETKTCQYCVYRSLCGRGMIAGDIFQYHIAENPLDDLDSLLQDYEVDQIPEIVF